MDLVLATRNKGKKREIEDLLRGLHGIALRTLDEFPDAGDPEENGKTFAQNAMIKAKAAAEVTGLWALADDSGLCVEALGGRPGIHTARYAEGPDEARWTKLLGELSGVADRRAAFVCALALVGPGGERVVEEARCEGLIADGPRGTHGFGYDPIFLVQGDAAGRTMAELDDAEKRALSHRGRAFAALRPQLARLVRG